MNVYLTLTPIFGEITDFKKGCFRLSDTFDLFSGLYRWYKSIKIWKEISWKSEEIKVEVEVEVEINGVDKDKKDERCSRNDQCYNIVKRKIKER